MQIRLQGANFPIQWVCALCLGCALCLSALAGPSLDAGLGEGRLESEESAPKIVQAEIVGRPFDKFLKYQNYRLELSDGQAYHGGFVFGPGHHTSAMAALVLDPKGIPFATFKTGDTRLSRGMRGAPYVAISGIAGRWDKAGSSSVKIVLGELAEEVGGSVVEGSFQSLGSALSATMPLESTESDEYFMSLIKLDGNPYGDGGQMEVLDLIGPVFFSPKEAIEAMDGGRISDAARARTMFARAWDAIGYLPELDVYVQDFPALSQRFDTLGLGSVTDPRTLDAGGTIPEPRPPRDSLQARINAWAVESCQLIPLEPGRQMVDARIRHAVIDKDQEVVPASPEFASQFLSLDYDRAKVVLFCSDAQRGPLVEMTTQVRPALAFAPGGPAVVHQDIRDCRLERSDPAKAVANLGLLFGGDLVTLSPPDAASSGQSDLFYHYLARRLDAPVKDLVPIAEAIRLCRQGHGDAQTEATLLRLADYLDWIPELGMSRSAALDALVN